MRPEQVHLKPEVARKLGPPIGGLQMKSLRTYRAARSSQCEGKEPYDTFTRANRVAGRLTGARAYRCPHCLKWHVGHALRPSGRPVRPYQEIEE